MAKGTKFRTFCIDPGPMMEPVGIVYAASDWRKDDLRARGPARILVDQLAGLLDELEDGESIELKFTRTDMTKAQLDALPEI